jgi:hypothetical protein
LGERAEFTPEIGEFTCRNFSYATAGVVFVAGVSAGICISADIRLTLNRCVTFFRSALLRASQGSGTRRARAILRGPFQHFKSVHIDENSAIFDFVTAVVSRCNNDKRLKNDVKCRSRSR